MENCRSNRFDRRIASLLSVSVPSRKHAENAFCTVRRSHAQNLLRLGHPVLDRARRAVTQRTYASCHTAAAHRQLVQQNLQLQRLQRQQQPSWQGTLISSSQLYEKKVRRSVMATTEFYKSLSLLWIHDCHGLTLS